MRAPLLLRSTLLCLLVVSGARATEREPIQRTLILSEHPRNEAPRVYVGGRVSTVLRLEKACDPARTRLLGWEGHFDPVFCGGQSVLLYPRRDLTPDDRFLLNVTLVDGTELPFIVTSHRQLYGDREVDQEVNVFADRESFDAVMASLNNALTREQNLREENERYRKEENSIDHAYATLLANGDLKHAPFQKQAVRFIKDGNMTVTFTLLSGVGKAAVMVEMTNHDPHTPWRFGEARLTSEESRTDRPFALRMNRTELVPGASGTLAVVADKSAFTSGEGLVDLTLEIFRGDGTLAMAVVLDHRLIRQ